MQSKKKLLVLSMMIVLAGCAGLQLFERTPTTQQVTDEQLMKDASAAPLPIHQGKVITDNDQAFLSKVKMIEEAKQSIDLAYYIYNEDYSSSYMTKALIDAARRGVTVRLLVDYAYNYKRLDLYSMMEKLGGEGKGSLQVRFYGRPTKNIVKNAVYVTLGCGKALSPNTASAQCSKEKFAEIDQLFAKESIHGQSVAGRDISNLNIGNSGLFLSGLYGKNADVMAQAVQQGEGIDIAQVKQSSSQPTPQDKQNLKRLARVYLESKTGNLFQQLAAKGELLFAFTFYGQQLDPLYDTFTSVFPFEKKFSPEEKQDWDHFSDFLHHKLILADQKFVQMGGRNVEDSYHMHPNPLTEKYVFMDTDIYAELQQGGEAITRAFDRLWNFDLMVATMEEVRQHAPNDFVANYQIVKEICTKEEKVDEACVDRELPDHTEGLGERMIRKARELDRNADIYANQYLPKISKSTWPTFEVDPTATLAYLENLPFDKEATPLQRHYGSPVGEEAQNGKYIHDVWLKSLPDVCLAATKGNPKQIILHNAYFYPAANLTYGLSRLVDGKLDCSNVTVTVLTNSVDTTDLNIVNTMAKHALKAFTEFYQQNAKPGRSATFQYYEYQKPSNGPNLSLHSKVSVLGDDIIIGSANADVRSFMMDSNDAMFVRRAPNFVKGYVAFVNGMLNDPARTKKMNDYFINTSRDVMMQEDLENLHKLLMKYHADKRLNPAEQAQLEKRFIQTLNDSYNGTKNSISPENSLWKKRQEQNNFNEMFKPI